VDAAADAGKVVAAHAHAREGIENAVRAGVASIEHGTFADEAVLELMAAKGTSLVPTMATTSSGMRDPRIVEAMPSHVRSRFAATAAMHAEVTARARPATIMAATRWSACIWSKKPDSRRRTRSGQRR
jgi:imidazolonepropionase-like amidohydrolase